MSERTIVIYGVADSLIHRVVVLDNGSGPADIAKLVGQGEISIHISNSAYCQFKTQLDLAISLGLKG